MAPRYMPQSATTSLPADVLYGVIDELPPQECLKVLSLNKWFLSTFSPSLLRRFVREGTVFYLDLEERDASGVDSRMRSGAPFVVQSVDPESGAVEIRYPTYDAYGYERNDIHCEADSIRVDPRYRGGPKPGYQRSPAGQINWLHEAARGRVKVLDGETFRNRFMQNCQVCHGKRTKCAGCGKAGFSRALSQCGCTIPCPLCVGYEAAVREKDAYEARRAANRGMPPAPAPVESIWSVLPKSILLVIREASNTFRLEWKLLMPQY
ncbi:hypothetical protein CALVIDRAFT_127403 [Calocera viscosa TUFC12733]|uniref:F-box domain-containing protein n=1 Tax=Calocera viscosa (strain TUFC12733) TaxID=1330018 RepID=A0A167RS29_CALVF|nr:hypothetical protein CALVIDRAFT_127403 [Calocera viscosa TUFC12733]